MEFLQNILDSSDVPVVTAFLLGLMTALSPCPMVTNIVAIGFIGKNIDDRKRIFMNGLCYTAGRIISYTLLGLILFLGASKFHLAQFFTVYGERMLGPVLIVVGIVMAGLIRPAFPGFTRLSARVSALAGNGSGTGALLLGIVFALAFCPTSGVLYFAVLIPLSIMSITGLYLPAVYAVATGVPVIIAAFLLAFTVSGIAGFYNRVSAFQKWFNRLVAFVFISAGLYFVITFYILS